MIGVRNKLLLFFFVVLVVITAASLPWLMHCGIVVFLLLLSASSLFSSLDPHLSLIVKQKYLPRVRLVLATFLWVSK